MKAHKKKRVSETQMMEGPVAGFLHMYAGFGTAVQALPRLSGSGRRRQ